MDSTATRVYPPILLVEDSPADTDLTLRALKPHPKLHSLPVVMLTTSSERRDVNTAYELGADSYIVKPAASGYG